MAESAGRWRGRIVRVVRRRGLATAVACAILGVLVGLLLGRATAPGPDAQVGRAVESGVLPIALDADAIWTSSAEGRAPVSEALVALRRDDDASLVDEHLERWLEAYDTALVRLAGVNVPSAGRPVQRQFITAVTLSRDATELLGHAAVVHDRTARRDLTTEVGRLRTRSEQLMQGARASLADLGGAETDVLPLPALRELLEGRSG